MTGILESNQGHLHIPDFSIMDQRDEPRSRARYSFLVFKSYTKSLGLFGARPLSHSHVEDSLPVGLMRFCHHCTAKTLDEYAA